MKPLTIVTALALLALTGCGVSINTGNGGDSTAAESKPAPQTTSAAEVQELVQALRDEKARDDEYAAERHACGEVTPIDEYSEECAEPASELIVATLAETEAIVNELKSKVGAACREALNGGNSFIPIDVKKIGACSADVGAP